MNHPEWHAQLAEAYCVENRIPCARKFTDEELQSALAEVRLAKKQLYSSPTMRERLARHEGRPEHDMTTFGMPLVPGR